MDIGFYYVFLRWATWWGGPLGGKTYVNYLERISLSSNLPPSSSPAQDQQVSYGLRSGNPTNNAHMRLAPKRTPFSLDHGSELIKSEAYKKSHRGCKSCKRRRVKVCHFELSHGSADKEIHTVTNSDHAVIASDGMRIAV
jgi:hypothetical protein